MGELAREIAPHAGAIGTIAGTMMQYRGARDAARAAERAGQYEAVQYEQNAGQAQAAAQRAAAEERRKSRFAQSRALALAAASGGASDPTIVDIVADLAAEGTYRGLMDIYEGEDRARQMRMAAGAARCGGAVKAHAYREQANSSLLRGGMSLFTKYAKPLEVSPIGEMVPGQFSLTNPAYG